MNYTIKTNYKVLILVPSPNSHGGIANYFEAIKDSFSFSVSYFYRGVRKQNSKLSRFIYPFVQIMDYFKFATMILLNKYDLVHINTSFGKTSLIRDYFFIRILQLFHKEYIVFFRGIDGQIIKWIEIKWLPSFRKSFLKSKGILVLSNYLKGKILSYGYPCKITVETTVVDPALTKKLELDDILKQKKNCKITLLFLSRMEKAKGIYETINAFMILKNKGLKVELVICGDGSEFSQMRNYVNNTFCDGIIIKGHVQGLDKRNAFLSSDIFIFPSQHEGLPNSILEAMAFGLPVITSDVGGIPDFFQNGRMGFMTNDLSPKNIAALTETLILDHELRKNICEFNFKYAKQHFYAENAVKRLEGFYRNIITVGKNMP